MTDNSTMYKSIWMSLEVIIISTGCTFNPDLLWIEWLSGHQDSIMKYNTTEPSDSSQIVYHQASRSSPENFVESNGTAEDTTLFLGMAYVRVLRARFTITNLWHTNIGSNGYL